MSDFCRYGMGPCSERYRTLAILLALLAFLLGSGVFLVTRSENVPFRRVAVVGRGGQEITGWEGGLYYGKYYGAIAAFYAKPFINQTCRFQCLQFESS
ncbi:hypothetical protein BSKO_11300 [Bryopsis sp. KO-2023]|nr:hypothetical protein BSKO_11300 [Bryopsis sp. KO-2023]